MKIKNQSCKRSQKLDWIRVGRLSACPILLILFTSLSVMIQRKLGCRSRKQKRKNQPIARPRIEHCHWFIFLLLLAIPTIQFSLDHKWQSDKQNQCSVWSLDPIALHCTLMITTPTTTPSLLKTSFKEAQFSMFCLPVKPVAILVKMLMKALEQCWGQVR